MHVVQITDPSISSWGKVMDILYFCDSQEVIKIGFSTNDKRISSHERTGLCLRAVLPASFDDEQAMHRAFKQYQKGGKWGKEYYRPDDAIYEYIAALLKNGFASAFEDELDQLPRVPFSVWKPGSPALAHTLNNDAQYDLWTARTAKERVQYYSETAHLSSITDEWYTPKPWIDLAREVMGSIDLDPATSSPVNRKWINAPVFYTREMNGLSKDLPWSGNVWLNPPYGRGENSASRFLQRLIDELAAGRVTQAISCLNINSMSSLWFFNTVMQANAIHCIPPRRVEFEPPDPAMRGSSPNKGTVFSYFGAEKDRFAKVFGGHGTILGRFIPEDWAVSDSIANYHVALKEIRSR